MGEDAAVSHIELEPPERAADDPRRWRFSWVKRATAPRNYLTRKEILYVLASREVVCRPRYDDVQGLLMESSSMRGSIEVVVEAEVLGVSRIRANNYHCRPNHIFEERWLHASEQGVGRSSAVVRSVASVVEDRPGVSGEGSRNLHLERCWVIDVVVLGDTSLKDLLVSEVYPSADSVLFA